MEKSRIVAALLLACSLLFGEDVHPITHRRIAQMMGVGGSDWLVRPERQSEEKPDKALDALKIRKGAVAADIGAGVGYFTWRLAERVGPQGLVYGEDIQPEMLELLQKNMRERHIANVRSVLGTVDDPKLPASSVDLILLVDVYHEFSEPEKMLQHMREALKPNGRLVLLEYRGEDPNVPIKPEHKMTLKQVRAEVEPEGYRFEQSIETLPQQHIIVFRR
ncbi:MAG: methyltransferase domain-containing protein [Terriglobia bacterium]